MTLHFSKDEYNGGNYTYLIFGNMGKVAEEIRDAYNRQISRDLRALSPGEKEPVQLSQTSGYALRMTSGYRNPERNENVSGALLSSHQYGKALDLQPVGPVPGKTLSQLYCILQNVASGPGRKVFAERRGTLVPCDTSGVDHIHVGL
jgi:uncharacterized protein YcbK (DUF882 family)